MTSNVVLALQRAAELEISTDLTELGGENALWESRDELLQSDLLPDALDLLGDAWQSVNNTDAAKQFVLDAVRQTDHILIFIDSVEVILDQPNILADVGRELADTLIDLARSRRDEIGGRSLTAVLRLALGNWTTRYAIGDLLTRLDDRTPEAFARHAVRALGAAHEQWRDSGFLDVLRDALAGPVAADAAYELGMAELQEALEASDVNTAWEIMRQSRAHLAQAAAAEEGREDAECFGGAIDVVLTFAAGGRPTADSVGAIFEAADRYRLGWHELDHWRRPRADTSAAWYTLAETISAVSADLEEQGWYHTAEVVHHLLAAYSAHRTLNLIVKSGPVGPGTREPRNGLFELLAPQIDLGLLGRQDRIAVIRRWVEEGERRLNLNDPTSTVVPPELLEEGRTLLDRLSREPRPKELGRADRPYLRSLGLRTAEVDGLSPALAGRLETLLEARDAATAPDRSPVLVEIYAGVREGLLGCSDYVGQYAQDVDTLLLCLLRFLRSRLEMESGERGGINAYLRRLGPNDDDPMEAELGYDLCDWLTAQIGYGVRPEIRGVGSGRLDVAVVHENWLLVVELKREQRDGTWEGLRKYLPQASAYQTSEPSVGFLVVLDLTPKRSGQADLRSCVELFRVEPVAGSNNPRWIIAMRVQGNRTAPSEAVLKKPNTSRRTQAALNRK